MYPVLIAACAGVVTASAHLSSLMALDTSQVWAGQWWRILSGHLAHLTWRQYAVDAPVFIGLYSIYRKRSGAVSALVLSLFAAVTVSLAVMLAGRHQVYGGLSGVSCAAVTALLCSMINERPRQAFPYLMSAMFCSYLLFMGGLAGGVEVAQEAHLTGAASGVLFANCEMWLRRLNVQGRNRLGTNGCAVRER